MQNERCLRSYIYSYEEGYSIQETQLAIDCLFQEAWRVVAEKSPPDEVVSNLWRVAQTVGWAKDELAQVYLPHSQEVERKLADLSPRFEGYLEAKQEAEKDKE